MVVEPIIKVVKSSDPLLEKLLERNFLAQVQAAELVNEVLTSVRTRGTRRSVIIQGVLEARHSSRLI